MKANWERESPHIKRGRKLMDVKKKILVVAPNTWSFQELHKRKGEYDFIFVEDQFQKEKLSLIDKARLLYGLDFAAVIKRIVGLAKKNNVDGILGADDFISCLYASEASRKLGLKGARTNLELTFQHKFFSRELQKSIVPDYVPHFGLLDLKNPPAFPFFVKPIRGGASMMAARINSMAEFEKYKNVPWLRWFMYKRLLKMFGKIAFDVAGLPVVNSPSVFEDVVEGIQCTVEGVVYNGQHEILGVVDSVMYPGSKISFERFNFPSKLPNEVQQEMIQVSKKLMTESGFDFGFYNIEFFYDSKKNEIKIIEVNPRMAFQFTDLYEKVLGFNTFDLFLKMTAGENIDLNHLIKNANAKYKYATSFVQRIFQDGFVSRAPSKEEIAAVESEFKDVRVLLQASQGKNLSSDIFQDIESFRLMTVNVGANSEARLAEVYQDIQSRVKFQIKLTPSA
jgi:hypothetical protein